MNTRTRKPRPKYSFEIDCGGRERRNCGAFQSYGTINCEGNTLEELLDDASVDTVDQDGGEVEILPCDEGWMIDLITRKYYEQG